MPSHLIACPVTGFGQHALDPVVAGAHQRDAVTERCQPLAGDPQRVGVAVQPDQPQARELGEEALGVAAGAEGGVDQDGARAVGVAAGSARESSSSTQRSSRTGMCPWSSDVQPSQHLSSDSDGGPCTEVPVRERGPGVGEVRQGRFGQRPRCTGSVPVGQIK